MMPKSRAFLSKAGSRIPWALCLWLCAAGQVMAAEERWDYCPGPLAVPAPRTTPPKASDDAMVFTSEEAVSEGQQRFQLRGEVSAVRGDQYLEADSVDYDQKSDFARASGHVRIEQQGRVFTGKQAELTVKDSTGEIEQARFWLPDKHFRGEADKLFLQGKEDTQLQGVFLTSCEEGHEAWALKASEVHLDTAANEGVAKHARVEFMHVPVFYSPYLSFPLEGRKSGFLVPAIGESKSSGTDISVPYYWNIAPQRDATLTPRFMSKRGTLWQGEFRYLNEKNGGQLDAGYLGKDAVYGDKRTLFAWKHTGSPAEAWRTRINYRTVSDSDYLDDFSGQLSVSSTTQLEQVAQVDYVGKQWQNSLKLQSFQTLDESVAETARPYQRLPQLTINSYPFELPAGFGFQMNTEAVRFQREVGVVGQRYDLQPVLSLPLRASAGFLEPKAGLRLTRYDVEDDALSITKTEQRRTSFFSMDSGLFFERDVALGQAQLQTLEPRLYFLYVPYRDQNELPVFDSSLPVLSFGQLFRNNRFTGADRVGDAKQVSASLTTRFLDGRGRELASAALGRIFYLQDRRVTLPGGQQETKDASHWLAELKSHWLPSLQSRLNVEWDDVEGEWQRVNFDTRYYKDRRRVLNLGFRFEKELTRQADVSFLWPLSAHWNVVARRYYSLLDAINLETLAGLEYNSCCWAARVVRRTYRVDATDETESETLWLQLELKGLTSVGRKVDTLLEHDILTQ
jgi:LPS-assembly protein